MRWKFNGETPIYLQIMEHIKTQIAVGELKPGDKIPTVRELALEAQVNPNTMQKALSELEREGLLHSVRTSGRFVSESSERSDAIKKDLMEDYMRTFTENMVKLGYSPKESVQLYAGYVEKNDNQRKYREE